MKNLNLEKMLAGIDFSGLSKIKASLKDELIFMHRRDTMVTRTIGNVVLGRAMDTESLDMVVAAGSQVSATQPEGTGKNN